jgi:DNA-binding CsgD family transcriptional regulator
VRTVDAIRGSSYPRAIVRLLEADYRKALGVLYAAGEVEGRLAFPTPVLHALRELVPCDVVTFHESSRSPNRVLVYVGEPVGPMTTEIRDLHRLLEREDPLRPAANACRLTDVVSVREFRRTELYSCVQRPLGIEFMLWLYLDPARTDARLEFDRSDSDFRERDCAVLELLQPHFHQFLRAARQRPPAPEDASVLTPREYEVIGHVAEGRTNSEIAFRLGISGETVRKHLENAYEKLGVHTRTGAVAATFGRKHAGA